MSDKFRITVADRHAGAFVVAVGEAASRSVTRADFRQLMALTSGDGTSGYQVGEFRLSYGDGVWQVRDPRGTLLASIQDRDMEATLAAFLDQYAGPYRDGDALRCPGCGQDLAQPHTVWRTYFDRRCDEDDEDGEFACDGHYDISGDDYFFEPHDRLPGDGSWDLADDCDRCAACDAPL